MKNRQVLNNGMTLIELMIVIAILGIISAIAIPAYTGYVTSARAQECQQEVASLALAQEEFFLEQRTYFEGGSTGALETNSQGLWSPSEANVNNRNCSYVIVAGTTGIATSYQITATGINNLAGKGTIATKTKL
ncbi:hypothetical protein MNBD_GAMMA22-1425 [hydrothermal vent metagenome]|uniref:Type IV pilus biogenesis protein PilE n=1 Tax=hydrothermal vent metagenome TaxID=652676 RepID=A0A3B1A008_9ZZZZ